MYDYISLHSSRKDGAIYFYTVNFLNFLVTVILFANANARMQTDTVKSYELSDVVISASREEVLVCESPVAVSLINREVINAQSGNTLSTAISGNSGLFIKSYGGNRAVETISLRGMAAEHTVVFIDGIRTSNFQNGLTDLGISALANIERIEISRGGNSSLYGADAVGGVINIITTEPAELWKTRINGSIGANGFSAMEFSGSGKLSSSLSFDGNGRREYAKNDFAFYFDDGNNNTLLRRMNADFSFTNVSAKILWKSDNYFSSFVSLNGTSAKRGSPGAVTTAHQTGKARLNDDSFRAMYHSQWSSDSLLQLHLSASFNYGNETYSDPNIILNNASLHTTFINRMITLSPEIRTIISSAYSTVLGGEFVLGNIASNAVKKSERKQISFYTSQEIHFSSLSNAVIFPSLRYDWFSDVGDAVSPKIGMNVAIFSLPNIHFRSSFGKSFRIPSFNDLYWNDGGNPALRPEHSVSFDFGIIAEQNFFGKFSFETNFFSISTKDRILWMPQSGAIWSPRNIGKVQSDGVELEMKWSSSALPLQFTSNMTWNDVKKKNEDFPNDPTYNKNLIYLPMQTFNFTAIYSPAQWSFFLQYMWNSFRYTTAFNDKFLPHYDVVNFATTYRTDYEHISPFYKLEITNCFNTSYQVITSYPMPLREYRLSFGIEWK